MVRTLLSEVVFALYKELIIIIEPINDQVIIVFIAT